MNNTIPKVDIEGIAKEYDIDLSKPLTRENAEVLNYAFMNNPTIPEGTVVRVQYDEANDEFVLDVGIVTTVKLPYQEYSDIASEPNFVSQRIESDITEDGKYPDSVA